MTAAEALNCSHTRIICELAAPSSFPLLLCRDVGMEGLLCSVEQRSPTTSRSRNCSAVYPLLENPNHFQIAGAVWPLSAAISSLCAENLRLSHLFFNISSMFFYAAFFYYPIVSTRHVDRYIYQKITHYSYQSITVTVGFFFSPITSLPSLSR